MSVACARLAGMDVVTLVIAVGGLALSAVSLTWQVVQHRLSGSRVKAELLWGGRGPDRIISGPVRGDLRQLRGAGVTETIMGVRGRNVGRLPVDITDFAIELDGGMSYSLPGWQVNPSTPHRLEPGSVASFYVPLDDVNATIEAVRGIQEYGGRIRGRLGLGNGETAASPWTPYPPTET
jgi:hypothetical protein